MPSAPGYKRNYKQERKTSLDRGERDANVARKQARRDLEKDGRVKPKDGKDVNHKTPLSKGGSTALSNLEVTTIKKNRAFARKKDGSMK